MFIVQFPEIVSLKAEKLNTPLTGQKACPLPASVLRKLALCFYQDYLYTYDINIHALGNYRVVNQDDLMLSFIAFFDLKL